MPRTASRNSKTSRGPRSKRRSPPSKPSPAPTQTQPSPPAPPQNPPHAFLPKLPRKPTPAQLSTILTSITSLQKKLSCTACGSLLHSPTRLLVCHHVLCPRCASSSVATARCAAKSCALPVRPADLSLAPEIAALAATVKALVRFRDTLDTFCPPAPATAAASGPAPSPVTVRLRVRAPSKCPPLPLFLRVRPPPHPLPLRLRVRPAAGPCPASPEQPFHDIPITAPEAAVAPCIEPPDRHRTSAAPVDSSLTGHACDDTLQEDATEPVARVPREDYSEAGHGAEEAVDDRNTSGLALAADASPVLLRLRLHPAQDNGKEDAADRFASDDSRQGEALADVRCSPVARRLCTTDPVSKPAAAEDVEHGAREEHLDEECKRSAFEETHERSSDDIVGVGHRSGSAGNEIPSPTILEGGSPQTSGDKFSVVLSQGGDDDDREWLQFPALSPQGEGMQQGDGSSGVRIDEPAVGAFFVCVTSMKRDILEVELVHELVARLGGEIALGFRDGAQPCCVVTPLNPQTRCIEHRTMIVHEALARRVPVVDLNWLVACFKAGTWLDTKVFEAATNHRRSGDGVFHGVVASLDDAFDNDCAAPLVRKAGEDIRDLLRAGGAVVVDTGQVADSVNGSKAFLLHIHVVCEFGDGGDTAPQVSGDDMELMRSSQPLIPTKLVNMPWISDCLFSGMCPPPSTEKSESMSGFSENSVSEGDIRLTPVQ